MNEDTQNSPTQSGGNKNLPIIIGTIAALVAGCIVGFFLIWTNRPVNRVEQALKQDYDITTINQYYDKLKNNEQITVDQKLLEYANQLYDEYYMENSDYEDVIRIYADLEAKALIDNDEFKNLKDNIITLKNSRDNYKSGQEAFNSGDYLTAMKHFQLVSQIDPNYSEALSLYEDSRKLFLIGDWSAVLDLSGALSATTGIEIDESISLPIEIICTFNVDGAGGFSYNVDDKEALMSSLSKATMDMIIKQLARSYGVDESSLDSIAKFMGFSDIMEFASGYIAQNLDTEKIISEITGTSLDFNYTINDNSVELVTDTKSGNLSFQEDGSLAMDGTEAAELFHVDKIVFVKKLQSL